MLFKILLLYNFYVLTKSNYFKWDVLLTITKEFFNFSIVFKCNLINYAS